MNRVKEIREGLGLRQQDVAEKLNTHKSVISRYERGELDLNTGAINALCDLFGCTADHLLGRSQSPQPVLTDRQIRLRRLPAGRGGGLFLKALPGLFSAVPNNSVLLQTLLQAKIIRPDRFRADLFISSCIRPGSPRSLAPGRCPDRTLPDRRSVFLGRGRLRPLRL